MSNQELKEYQMLGKEYDKEDIERKRTNQRFLGGSDLTDNRFQDPNVIPKEEIVFEDDFKKIFFAEKDDQENVLKNMTEETYDEYSNMRRDYIKTDYFDRSED